MLVRADHQRAESENVEEGQNRENPKNEGGGNKYSTVGRGRVGREASLLSPSLCGCVQESKSEEDSEGSIGLASHCDGQGRGQDQGWGQGLGFGGQGLEENGS